uniref:Uncharacterized protein n=1 Tax=uncultured Thiotrichaceae bacterium TaxID=298394 RepID=A0A6S6UIT5_9GAMM|nr:MAG: Unknown protein [uncultured Thiotrichaceae bacterium]
MIIQLVIVFLEQGLLLFLSNSTCFILAFIRINAEIALSELFEKLNFAIENIYCDWLLIAPVHHIQSKIN